MTTDELKNRFKNFALGIVKLAMELPADRPDYKNVRGQMIRSGTSSAANYRAACRRKSAADFIAKLGIVEEETDETLFWLEFLVGLSEEWREKITPHWKEGNELLSIVVASIKTARENKKVTIQPVAAAGQCH